MPWIAKTNGATTGEASEIREGTLADIPAADRGNWRAVNGERPDVDGLTQQFVRTGLPIAGNGTVSVAWEIYAEPAAVVKLRLGELANTTARTKLATTTIEVLSQSIRIDDATFSMLKNGRDTIDAGVATTVGVVTATGQVVSANLSQLNTALLAIVTARQAILAAFGTITAAVAAGTVTTSAGVTGHAAWP